MTDAPTATVPDSAAFTTLRIERPDPHLMVLTLDRPAVRNALDTRMGEELRALFTPLLFTPGALRCIVITGAGDAAFCAGGDLKERRGMTDEQWRAQHAIFEEAIYAVMDCPVPVIAAVNGAAFGGGFELALACDFIYAAQRARFALTEVTLGIIPGCGGTQNLPRAAGARRARELLYTGQAFGPDEALAWGIVNRVVADDELLAQALATARRIAASAPIAARQAKRAVDIGLQLDLKSARVFEVQAYERCVVTEDRREGIEAFNAKRPPVYQGR